MTVTRIVVLWLPRMGVGAAKESWRSLHGWTDVNSKVLERHLRNARMFPQVAFLCALDSHQDRDLPRLEAEHRVRIMDAVLLPFPASSSRFHGQGFSQRCARRI